MKNQLRTWFCFCFYFALLNFSVLTASDVINQLELNRLFTHIHHERMQELALGIAPDAHSHTIDDISPSPPSAPVSAPAPASAPVPAPSSPSQSSFAPTNQRPSFMAPQSVSQPVSPNLVNQQFSKQQSSGTTGVAQAKNSFATNRMGVAAPQSSQNMMNSFLKNTVNSENINNFALTSIEAVRFLLENRLKDHEKPFEELSSLRAPPRFCPFKNDITCDVSFPYRSYDGSCNNLKNPWWGKSEMPFKRYLQPDYADGLSEPRISVDGGSLPNERDIACALHSETYDIEPFVTNMFMQWGQLINHDITSLAITMDDERNISRCDSCKRTQKCVPIMINPDTGAKCGSLMSHPCIEFKRSSASYPDPFCSMGKREQLNLQTPFIDASAIYGISEEEVEKLRDRQKGRGLMLLQPNRLLPQDLTPRPSDCLEFKEKERCFRAGDDRVNQNPALMGIQTIMVREHNRIASILGSVNPAWHDETVFQETRRIIIAMMQHITFNEFIPILLGPTVTSQFGLTLKRGLEYFTLYNPNVDPRLANEWSAAAGRFGHSMIRGKYSRLDSDYKPTASSYMLRNAYFRSNYLYDQCQGGLESVMRGLLKDPIMKVDRFFSTDISQHLFETADDMGRPFHFDLVAINIARGRDHGVPSYIKFRQFCRLPELRTWTELKQVIPDDTVEIFKQLYKYVDDLDLFTAAVAENKLEDALVGPTLACMLGIQYRDMRFGDRFWYETNAPPARFTTPQLNEIRKMSLSKLLCRNMEDTPKIQARAMVSFKLEDNPLVDCNELSDINWNLWKA